MLLKKKIFLTVGGVLFLVILWRLFYLSTLNVMVLNVTGEKIIVNQSNFSYFLEKLGINGSDKRRFLSIYIKSGVPKKKGWFVSTPDFIGSYVYQCSDDTSYLNRIYKHSLVININPSYLLKLSSFDNNKKMNTLLMTCLTKKLANITLSEEMNSKIFEIIGDINKTSDYFFLTK